jgi:tRNA (guanine-N7-)-methyltransferase
MPNQPGRDRPDWHGRRQGRRLRPGRQRLMSELLPRLRVALPPAGASLDPFALFQPRPREVWLEIGFGGGEHLAAQAERHPEIGFLGSEVFVNGIAALLDQVDRHGMANLRIFDDDARLLLPALPGACLGRVFLLFPDPWPKKRHEKRRFIGPANLAELARVLADGGELRMASDDAGHIRWILEQTASHPAFRWRACRPSDWRSPPADWVDTRYQEKARAAGRRATFLSFERRARPD